MMLFITVYNGSTHCIKQIFSSIGINTKFISKWQYNEFTAEDWKELKPLNFKQDFSRKELIFLNILTFESLVIVNKKDYKETISLLGYLNNKNKQEIKALFKRLGDSILSLNKEEAFYEEELIKQFLEHVLFCLKENATVFYNMHNMIENFALTMLAKNISNDLYKDV